LTSLSATAVGKPRKVLILLCEGTVGLDAMGPAQAFHEARGADGQRLYSIIFASPNGGEVALDCGAVIVSCRLYDIDVDTIDTLRVPGADDGFAALNDTRLLDWLRTAKPRVRRIGSICIGAFLLAGTGLLDGEMAVTHWRWCDQLSARFPNVTVLPDQIYVRCDNIWTSAGVTAGIDMSLAMIEADHGRSLALSVARTLVVFLRRPGKQSQFSAPLLAESRDQAGTFDALLVWINDNIAERLDIDTLAARMGMSPRNFARLFGKHVGDTPANMIRKIRLERARQMLENTTHRIVAVANQCGFRDVETMRRVFRRELGTAPEDYREIFSTAARAFPCSPEPP
jgi:transcriptional regulator GlxA family with amidase domain